jgi:hypothetical protein
MARPHRCTNAISAGGFSEHYGRAHVRVMGFSVAVTKLERNSKMPGRKKTCCGARNRRGTACQAKALENGRCKFHGGMSTGPKTPEGRARISAAVKDRWARHFAEVARLRDLEQRRQRLRREMSGHQW